MTLASPVLRSGDSDDSTLLDAPDPIAGRGEQERSALILSVLLRQGDALRKAHDELADRHADGVREGNGTVWIPEPVLKEVLDEDGEQDAPDELVVQIARRVTPTLNETLLRLRRVLRRERRIEPVARVQQLDAACLRWLVRQPGKTATEMAGPRQEVLSVVREESFNTLENRVVKDFMRLCRIERRRYLSNYSRRFQDSANVKFVRDLDGQCRSGLMMPEFASVTGLALMPQPNYALQFDDRYRTIWTWYQKLRRREEQKTELWRWRHRAWAELVTLDLMNAAWRSADPGSPFEGEVGIRRDPDRGAYIHPGSSFAPCRLPAGWVRVRPCGGTEQDTPAWCDAKIDFGREFNDLRCIGRIRAAAWPRPQQDEGTVVPEGVSSVLVGDWEEETAPHPSGLIGWPVARPGRGGAAQSLLNRVLGGGIDHGH